MEYGAIVPFSLNGSLAHGNEEGKKKGVLKLVSTMSISDWYIY
jgi:hypothetical protein